MTSQLNKFWSLKDTKHYKSANYKHLCNSKTQRRFIFEKSYLLQVYLETEDEYYIVIPIHFQTDRFPNGSYCGITNDKLRIYFSDKDIVRVIN